MRSILAFSALCISAVHGLAQAPNAELERLKGLYKDAPSAMLKNNTTFNIGGELLDGNLLMKRAEDRIKGLKK